jgi:hypothetical protein
MLKLCSGGIFGVYPRHAFTKTHSSYEKETVVAVSCGFDRHRQLSKTRRLAIVDP